jgi:hypothetical protein
MLLSQLIKQEESDMTVSVDEMLWPIVTLTYEGSAGGAEMASSINFYQRMFVRGQRFCVVLDTRRSSPPSIANMQIFKRFVDQNARDFKALCAGISFVMSGGVVMRMALRSLLQISSPPFPHRFCAETQEAIQWCEGQLQLTPIAA